MQMHSKKRIDLIIEMPLLRRVTERFERAGVTGYSVVPVMAGCGHSGPWSAEGQVGTVGQMAMVICILDQSKVDTVLDEVFAVVKRHVGFVTVSDVQVVRPERF